MCSRLSHITHSSRFFCLTLGTRCCFNRFSWHLLTQIVDSLSKWRNPIDTWVNPLATSFVTSRHGWEHLQLFERLACSECPERCGDEMYSVFYLKYLWKYCHAFSWQERLINIEQGLMKGGRRLFRSSNKIFRFATTLLLPHMTWGTSILEDSI